jgi:hypothetical protein
LSERVHIIIPDSHAHPDFSNKRYDWLGELIADVKPDVVVDIGDWFDMPSLCSYDRGTKSFEGRRYKRDIEAGLDAQERMLAPILRQKRKLPRFVRTLGNHEQRIVKAIERDPVLEGTIGLSDLQSKEYRWEEYPFLEPVNIDGVNYAHYFTSGVLGRAVPNARQLLIKHLASCTMGHHHTFDYARQSNINNQQINALVCGVFQDYKSDYAGPANSIWDRGVVIKRDVHDGMYDMEWISLKRLKEAYGSN